MDADALLDLAWKVLCQVGIAGKVVGVKLPNGVGERRSRSESCPGGWSARELPATAGLGKSVEQEDVDSGQRM